MLLSNPTSKAPSILNSVETKATATWMVLKYLLQNPIVQLSHLCFILQKSVCIDCNGEEDNAEDNHDRGVLGEVGLGSEIIDIKDHYFLLKIPAVNNDKSYL